MNLLFKKKKNWHIYFQTKEFLKGKKKEFGDKNSILSVNNYLFFCSLIIV